HFVETWGPLLRRRSTPARRVMERDGWRCKTPGCTRPSAQNHHIVFSSQGGEDDPGNRTALCAPHHLRGIHGGRLRVSGTAPDHLVWELRSGRRLK
ncbi:MAG TPA: HNH endonuclease signature motif containing protein, partial [Anaeromyxobacteraceae bacterium]